MELTMLLVADYANVDREGKANVMGIFNEVLSKQFPAIHPEMRVVFTLVASPAEQGTKKVAMKLIDEDGSPLVEWERDIPIPAYEGRRNTLSQIIRLTGLQFPRAGEYSFRVLVDGDDKGSTPLYVTLIDDQ